MYFFQTDLTIKAKTVLLCLFYYHCIDLLILKHRPKTFYFALPALSLIAIYVIVLFVKLLCSL